ncbi:hypothetical protein BH10PSE7_BH10PSE7_45080 [soil metagenome]
MGDFLTNLASGASWLHSMQWIPHFALASTAVPISLLFGAIGAFLLGRYTRALGFFAFPANFAVLFLGGLGGNWLLSALKLRFQEDYQGPMIFALLGMTLAAVTMMVVVKGD